MKWHVKWFMLSLAILSLWGVACSSQDSAQSAAEVAPPLLDPQAPGDVSGYEEEYVTTSSEFTIQEQGANQSTAAQERLIIKSASLALEVDDAATVAQQVNDLAVTAGGWVVSSNISNGTYLLSNGDEFIYTKGVIQVRVPAERFDGALEQIKSLALKVNSEMVDGEDVTAEFVDLNSQLDNLKAAEAQLQTIMENATRTQDVLDVYDKLVEKRGEINVIEGRIKYLRESSAYSSITVNLSPQFPEDKPTPKKQKSFISRTVEDALNALEDVGQAGVTLAIWLALVLLPVLVVLGVLFWLVYRLGRLLVRRLFRPKSV